MRVVRVIIQEFKDQNHYDKVMKLSYGEPGKKKNNLHEIFRGSEKEFTKWTGIELEII